MRLRIACSVSFLAAILCSAALAAEVPHGFRLEGVVGGLTEPTSMAGAEDGRILITEKTTGAVRLVQLGELLPTPVCTIAVETAGEGGLLDVAVHPEFVRNGWFYVYHTAAGGVNKVTRYTLSGTSCSSPVDIVSLGAGTSYLRNGCGVAFGPDGKLFVATGDFENGADAQNDASLAGKILRLNDDGSIPSDNPTPGSRIFAKGVRNGNGLAVDEAGNVYVTDAGSVVGNADDELNKVPSGGNLGWDAVTGNSGGTYDDPLASWVSAIGVRGLSWYGSNVFPDAALDGIDNDEDRMGADRNPGVGRTDDDGNGTCIGSNNNELPCTSNANCPPRRVVVFDENSSCEFRDEADEYCPAGSAYGDDGCGSLGIRGVDEADESFVNNLFFAAPDVTSIYRAVLEPGALDQLRQTEKFVDSAFLPSCPSGWTDTMAGRDGFLYALAKNGGGNAGALYRVVHDETPGPREVSKPGSHFPLRVDKGAGSDVQVSWEDLRSDAMQPRDDGNADPAARQPLQPAREYTVWKGTLGNWTSHAPVGGLTATAGTPVNEALRRATVTGVTDNSYFLVSARHANLEGTLGANTAGTPRTGYATTNLCDTLGYHGSANTYALWLCGQDFTLRDEHGETHALYEFREQVVMLDLSAIWCPPCVSEANLLQNVYQQYKNRGVRFLTVLMDEDNQLVDFAGRPVPAECRNWSDRPSPNLDHTFPCWVDPNDGSKDAWPKYNKFGALPTNVLLDTGLRVIYSGAGYDEATIKNKLDRLVGTSDQCVR